MHEEQTSTVNVDERLRPFLTPEIKLLIDHYLSKGWLPSRVHSRMRGLIAHNARFTLKAVGAYLDQIVDPNEPIDLEAEGEP